MDRPPTILGPHGEGYCRHCRFIEPLDQHGAIEAHGSHPCEGGGTRPPARTPYASKLSSFTTVPPYAECPVCKGRAAVVTAGKVMGRHFAGANVCAGTGRPAGTPKPGPGRDHSNERG